MVARRSEEVWPMSLRFSSGWGQKLIAMTAMGLMSVVLSLSANGAGDSNGTDGGTTQSPAPAGPGGGGINDGAKSGGAQSGIAQVINIGMGAVMMSRCPKDAMACMMALQLFMQASADGGAAGEFGNVEGLTGDYGFDTSGYGTDGYEGYDGTSTASAGVDGGATGAKALQEKALKGISRLNELGYKDIPDAQAIEFPDGKKVPYSATNSAAGMASAGFSPSQIASGLKLQKKAQEAVADKYKVTSMGLASAGGSGGGYGNSYEEDEEQSKRKDPLAAYLASLKKKNRKPASMAGMQRRLANGSTIGVKSDNIFDMIHRRYQKKRAAKEFIRSR